MINNTLLNSLPEAERVENIFAYLSDESGNILANFLYNPEEKSFNKSSNFKEAPTLFTNLPNQQFQYSSGLTLELNNLLLESYTSGRSCKTILETLQRLMEPDTIGGKYEPSRLNFVWGSDVFGPAFITDLSWNETSWLNGQVASARVNLKLIQVPSKETVLSIPDTQPLSFAINLTARQIDEAKTKARSWLNINRNKLKNNLSDVLLSNNFELRVETNGNITLLSKDNKSLGYLGKYDGKTLDTNKTELIK